MSDWLLFLACLVAGLAGGLAVEWATHLYERRQLRRFVRKLWGPR